MKAETLDRRNFIKKSSALVIGSGTMIAIPNQGSANSPTQDSDLFIVGPKKGFTPEVGTLVSMMNWTRRITTEWVKKMTMEDLDFLVDPKANSVGVLLLHIISQEKECQVQTFNWERSKVFDQTDAVVSNLGDDARRTIKGNEVDFYLKELEKVRSNTFEELRNRDDRWLMEIDNNHPWGVPVNNYCQWFHVIEHECQHAGQIAFLKNRVPSSEK